MSRMVSLFKGIHNTRLEGYMLSNGEIHYSWIRNNHNTGTVTSDERLELIRNFKMICVFDHEKQAKEEFKLLGFLL